MFIFGHLGIGNKLASPWSRDLPKFPLFLGMLLPDIIDKPLYYSHFWAYISCTRTFGHSGAFLFLIMLTAALCIPFSRSASRWLGALALGISTHLLLDCLLDRLAGTGPSASFIALAWPFLYERFATFPLKDLHDHLMHLLSAPILISEGVGLSFLGWDFWKARHRLAIRQIAFSRRWRRIKRRRLERD